MKLALVTSLVLSAVTAESSKCRNTGPIIDSARHSRSSSMSTYIVSFETKKKNKREVEHFVKTNIKSSGGRVTSKLSNIDMWIAEMPEEMASEFNNNCYYRDNKVTFEKDQVASINH